MKVTEFLEFRLPFSRAEAGVRLVVDQAKRVNFLRVTPEMALCL
jgi:hypothetical protein